MKKEYKTDYYKDIPEALELIDDVHDKAKALSILLTTAEKVNDPDGPRFIPGLGLTPLDLIANKCEELIAVIEGSRRYFEK